MVGPAHHSVLSCVDRVELLDRVNEATREVVVLRIDNRRDIYRHPPGAGLVLPSDGAAWTLDKSLSLEPI